MVKAMSDYCPLQNVLWSVLRAQVKLQPCTRACLLSPSPKPHFQMLGLSFEEKSGDIKLGLQALPGC